jgi:hypothetical protein
MAATSREEQFGESGQLALSRFPDVDNDELEKTTALGKMNFGQLPIALTRVKHMRLLCSTRTTYLIG